MQQYNVLCDAGGRESFAFDSSSEPRIPGLTRCVRLLPQVRKRPNLNPIHNFGYHSFPTFSLSHTSLSIHAPYPPPLPPVYLATADLLLPLEFLLLCMMWHRVQQTLWMI